MPVLGDEEQRRAREHGRGDPGIARHSVAVGQPVRDASGEDHAAQRDRHRGDQPQPHLVVPEQRVRDGEQIRQRLPRWRRVRVQRPDQRLVTPHEPAVGIEPRTRARPQDEHDRDREQADPGENCRVVAARLTGPRPGALARESGGRRRPGTRALTRARTSVAPLLTEPQPWCGYSAPFGWAGVSIQNELTFAQAAAREEAVWIGSPSQPFGSWVNSTIG